MCRMMGVLSKDYIKAGFLHAFEPLCLHGKIRKDMTTPGHHDGWGLAAYFREKFPEYVERQAHSESQDRELFKNGSKLIEDSRCKVALLHFRKISVGAPQLSNTHPFLYKEWSFAHNGTIFDSDKIPLKSLKPSGSTDTERYFLYLMEHLPPVDSRLSPGQEQELNIEAIKKAVDEIKRNFKYSSLTFLLTDGGSILAYRDCDPQFDEYYTLYTAEVNGSRILSSEPLLSVGKQWASLKNGEYFFQSSFVV